MSPINNIVMDFIVALINAIEIEKTTERMKGFQIGQVYKDKKIIHTIKINHNFNKKTSTKTHYSSLHAPNQTSWHACCNIPFTQKIHALICIKQQDYCLFDKKGKRMSTYINSPKNLLIDALCLETQRRLFPHLEVVHLEMGEVIAESGDVMKNVYFPIDSIVSLLYDTREGNSTEISLVGNEGFVGIALFMGGDSTPSRAVVQSAGNAYRLSSRKFKEELNQHGDLQKLMLRYIQSLFTQMAQTAVCNRHHSINQQLCRFLLLMLDRLSDNHLLLTQELIANMLGVRREGVTDAAGKLQKLGVIEYTRGHITVLDRAELENLTCECYTVVKQETDRLLPQHHLHQHNIYRQSA